MWRSPQGDDRRVTKLIRPTGTLPYLDAKTPSSQRGMPPIIDWPTNTAGKPLPTNVAIKVQVQFVQRAVTMFTTSRGPRKHREMTKERTHAVFGHAARERIQQLPLYVDGIKLMPSTTTTTTPRTNECTPYALSKSKQQILRRERHFVRTPFGLVLLDLVYFAEGYNGDKYMLHAVNQHTGFHFVSTVRSAEQYQFVRFAKLIYTVAHYCGKNVLCSGSDDTPTFGYAWHTLLLDNHTMHAPSAPHTQAQDAAERPGALIIEMARTIRINARLPHELWPELVSMAMYILNRLPIQKKNWKTPFELITNRKPDCSHMRVAGCKAYTLKKDLPKLNKLNPRATIGYLVEYDSSNIYRIWVPSKQRVIRTRNMLFNKTQFYDPTQLDLSHAKPPEQWPIATLDEQPPKHANDVWGAVWQNQMNSAAAASTATSSKGVITLAQQQQPQPLQQQSQFWLYPIVEATMPPSQHQHDPMELNLLAPPPPSAPLAIKGPEADVLLESIEEPTTPMPQPAELTPHQLQQYAQLALD